MSTWFKFCASQALLPGEHRVDDVDGLMVAVYNIGGELYAIEDVCTHDGGELAGGPVVGLTIECIRHGAIFDLKTGQALCAPAYSPTKVLESKLEAEHIWVRWPD